MNLPAKLYAQIVHYELNPDLLSFFVCGMISMKAGDTLTKGTIRGQTKPKDTMSRLFFQDNAHFSEVYNHTSFKDHPFSPDDLEDQDSAEVASIRIQIGSSIRLQQYRDVCKRLKRGIFLVILGLENQTYVDWLMVFRSMLMDVINYARQISVIAESKKENGEMPRNGNDLMSGFSPEDKLIPCQTLVIYYGKEPWTAPTSLSGLFSEDVTGLGINDWHITVIDVRRMTDEEIASYGPEMKAFFSFIKYSEDAKKVRQVIQENSGIFSNLGDLTYDTLTELTNSPELRKIKTAYRTAEGGIDVCAGIKGLIETSEKKGFKKGEVKGEDRLGLLISKLLSLGRNEDAAKAAEDKKYRKKLYAEFGIT